MGSGVDVDLVWVLSEDVSAHDFEELGAELFGFPLEVLFRIEHATGKASRPSATWALARRLTASCENRGHV